MLTKGIYLLDTDISIAMVKGHKNVRQHIRQHDHLDLKISEITIAEMLFGAVKSGKEKHFNDVISVQRLFEDYKISGVLREYADIRHELESNGKPIDSFDLLIAATARYNDLILVTNNTKHFSRISGLRIENWMKE